MYYNMCLRPECLPDAVLNVRCMLMRLVQSHLTRHTYVHLNGIVVTDAARAEVVHLAYALLLKSNIRNLLFDIIG